MRIKESIRISHMGLPQTVPARRQSPQHSKRPDQRRKQCRQESEEDAQEGANKNEPRPRSDVSQMGSIRVGFEIDQGPDDDQQQD
jgi:hypothetical protein